MIRNLKIILLTENSVGIKNWATCLAEWGFSALIEFGDKRILFDTGMTDLYLKNAKNLGIDLSKIDSIVFSHNHKDHTGGILHYDFKNNAQIVSHPRVIEILTKQNKEFIKDFSITSSKVPLEIYKDIYFLGEIPRMTSFEDGKVGKDEMLDDSALAFKTSKGVVVVTGCSHSGVCNICEYAKKITGQQLYAVIGGFHLLKSNKSTLKSTIEYFKNENPTYLYPTHCVDLESLSKFYEEFGITKISAGDEITFES